MTRQTVSPNAYTDAPALHPNLVVGSLQLLFWLFFHPSAWRNHVARIAPSLAPDFKLIDLTREQWRNPNLRRLLLTYLVLPALFDLLVICLHVVLRLHIVLGWGLTVRNFIVCVPYGVAGGIAAGMTVSAAAGIAYGPLLGFLIGLSPEGGYVGVMYGLAAGLAGSVVGGTTKKAGYALRKQIGGSLIGLVIGGVILGVAYTVVSGLAFGVEGPRIREGNVAHGPVIGLGVAVLSWAVYSAVLGWYKRNWRYGARFGMVMGLVMGMAYIAMVGSGSLFISEFFGAGPAGGITFGTFFGVAYMIARHLGGARAGSVAGAFVSGFVWLPLSEYVFWDPVPVYPTVIVCLMLIPAGLTLNLWRPALLYPFFQAWNTLLYQADKRRPDRLPSLLRRHSAFWDEHQRLPLYGLEDHLVLIAERDPTEAQAAIEYLSASRQRWAVQAAQIELDARRLERCADVAAIGRAHHDLGVSELHSPAQALLRSLGQISRDVEAALNQATAYHRRMALVVVEERLNGLLRELTRSSERYAVRFRPVALHWQRVVAGHVRELAEAVERSQEIDNPYIFGVPLTEQQEIFVGRTDIAARIEQLLLDPRRPPLLLYGQRRMGKTSLLRNLGRLLPSTIVPLFVDGEQISGAGDYPDLLYGVARAMARSAEQQRGFILPALSRQALADSPFVRFNEWLDEIERALDARGQNVALLALDEFEAIDDVLHKGRFDETDFLRLLRHLIQHRPRFKVLLASSHALEHFHHWAGYLINVQVVKIGYLEEAEARQLVERPVEGFALQYEPAASQRVLELARGHPHLLQLLCYEIVTLKNEHPPATRRLATLADVETAATRALETGRIFFDDIQWNQIDGAGVSLLRFLATYGEGAIVDRDTLAARFPSELDRTLARLLQRDLIEATDGGYRFQVELIRRWFAR